MNNLTNREVACLSWNTMYPDRRPFKELEESTKEEWERFISIVRQVCRIDGISCIHEIKEHLKDQL